MAEISKQALKTENQSSFPNNTSGLITPTILRNFNNDMIDSLVDEITFNAFSSSVTQSIQALQSFSSSLDTNFASQAEFNSFTQSADGRLDSLELATSSYANSASVAAVDAAQQLQINSLIAATASFVTEAESGSFLVTASFDNNSRDLTFTKGNASTFVVNIPASSGSASLPSGVVSGSSQIDYPLISNIPGGIISSSAQLPAGLVSGSSQVLGGTGILSSSNETFEQFSTSVDSRIDDLVAQTSSYAISSSVAAVDLAQQAQIDSLIAFTGSVTTPQTLVDTVYNGEATTITKGTPLYVSGSQGANPIVYRADASVASKMPVIYIANANITTGATGEAIVLGHIEGLDLTGIVDGTLVYVAEGGGWSTTRPSGSSSIVQPLGVVTKGGNGGKGEVLNPGPATLPNIQTGYVWVGNATNQPTAVATSSFSGGGGAAFPYTGDAQITGSLSIKGTNGAFPVTFKIDTPDGSSSDLTFIGNDANFTVNTGDIKVYTNAVNRGIQIYGPDPSVGFRDTTTPLNPYIAIQNKDRSFQIFDEYGTIATFNTASIQLLSATSISGSVNTSGSITIRKSGGEFIVSNIDNPEYGVVSLGMSNASQGGIQFKQSGSIIIEGAPSDGRITFYATGSFGKGIQMGAPESYSNNLFIYQSGSRMVAGGPYEGAFSDILVFGQRNSGTTTQFTNVGVKIDKDLTLIGGLTASMQEGYVWVGNGAGVSQLTPTSSFAINTSQFATTGSNIFVGNQTINANLIANKVSCYDFDTLYYGSQMGGTTANGTFFGYGSTDYTATFGAYGGAFDNELQTYVDSTGIYLKDFNGSGYNTFLKLLPNTGANPAPILTRGVQITGSVGVSGNSTFNGNQTINGTSKQTFNEPGNNNQVDVVKVNSFTDSRGYSMVNNTFGWQHYDGAIVGWASDIWNADYSVGTSYAQSSNQLKWVMYPSGGFTSDWAYIELTDNGNRTTTIELDATTIAIDGNTIITGSLGINGNSTFNGTFTANIPTASAESQRNLFNWAPFLSNNGTTYTLAATSLQDYGSSGIDQNFGIEYASADYDKYVGFLIGPTTSGQRAGFTLNNGYDYNFDEITLNDNGSTTTAVLKADKVDIQSVLQLKQWNTLPTGAVGQLAVSGSNLFYHNGTSWSQIN